MTRGIIYKAVFIAAIIAFAIMLILPTVGEKEMEISLKPGVTEGQLGEIKDRFSSDSYTVEVKDGSVIVDGRNLTTAIMNEMRTFPGVSDAVIRKHWAEDLLLAKKINLGLDLQGGMHLVMQANFSKIEEELNRKREADERKKLTEKEKNEITQQALELIRNRIDKFGVAEPSIRPRGAEAIEIQLPGVRNPKAVKDALGTTGRVEYRLVNDDYSREAAKWLSVNYNEEQLPEDFNERQELLEAVSTGIDLPGNLEALYMYGRDRDTNKIIPTEVVVLERDVAIAGDDISKAWVGQDEYGRLAVHFTTTAEGGSKFADVTSAKNRGRRLSIVIDDKVRSAPSINDQITTGKAIITGDFSQDEVKTLARIIKEGALPVDLQIIEERTVGPSLGQDSIESGIRAILIGLGGVMIFMFLWYKLSGFIANFALVLNMVFMLAMLSWLGFTLTLPGIAGFILTVGMAVDANVIIYERIKEEARSGKSVRMSIIHGYDKAFSTILDANLTTLIAAFILSQFGTGPIKGFAVVLLIGILSSMFVALYVTRFIFEIVSLNKKIKKMSM